MSDGGGRLRSLPPPSGMSSRSPDPCCVRTVSPAWQGGLRPTGRAPGRMCCRSWRLGCVRHCAALRSGIMNRPQMGPRRAWLLEEGKHNVIHTTRWARPAISHHPSDDRHPGAGWRRRRSCHRASCSLRPRLLDSPGPVHLVQRFRSGLHLGSDARGRGVLLHARPDSRHRPDRPAGLTPGPGLRRQAGAECR